MVRWRRRRWEGSLCQKDFDGLVDGKPDGMIVTAGSDIVHGSGGVVTLSFFLLGFTLAYHCKRTELP